MSGCVDNLIAVIGFSSAPSPLEPAWPSTHRALLPVAGKALIVRLIEQLARAGIRHVRVAGSIQQYAVRQRLVDGNEWGVTVRYADLHGADLRLQTLLEHGHALYVCGDNLHVADFSRLRATDGASVVDALARSEAPAYWSLGSDGPVRSAISAATSRPYLREPLLTAASFHAASVEAAANNEDQIPVPGYRVRPGLYIDWDSHISPSARLGQSIIVGKHCRIGRRVHLAERCVIGSGAVIARNTHLSNVSVLPNTYVGAGTRLRDAVITPLGLFSLDGTFLPSPDPSVIGRARRNAERRTGIPSEKRSVLENTALRSAANQSNLTGSFTQ